MCIPCTHSVMHSLIVKDTTLVHSVPYDGRIAPGHGHFISSAIVAFVRHFNWTRMTILSQEGEIYDEVRM